MPLILGTNSIKGGYEVANSLRVDRNSSNYLTRNETQAQSDGKKITISIWFKLGAQLGSTRYFFGGHADGSYTNEIGITANDQLNFSCIANGTNQVTTNRVFRDTSAWYHVVAVLDSTQGTSSNRIKLYINGVEETSFASSSYPSENAVTEYLKNGGVTRVGDKGSGGNNWDGYLAEIFVLDGQALTPSSFGEFDEDTPTVWKPKDCKDDLTFGNNGFYLDFEVDDTPGNDKSGNNNDFSNNNLTSVDQSKDTCTNNFATMNPLAKGPDITMTEGNLKVENGNSDNSVLGTIGLANGKFYWEAKCTGATTYANIGVTLASAVGVTHSNVDAGRVVYSHNGYVYKEGLSGQSNVSGLATFTTNDIIGVAFDTENGTLSFYKNNTLVNTTTDTNLLFTNNEYIPCSGLNQGGFSYNFGNGIFGTTAITTNSGNGYAGAEGSSKFNYQPPTGYSALSTKGLNE